MSFLKPPVRVVLAHVTEHLALDLLVGRPLRIRIPLSRHVRPDDPRAERAEHGDGLLQHGAAAHADREHQASAAAQYRLELLQLGVHRARLLHVDARDDQPLHDVEGEVQEASPEQPGIKIFTFESGH